MSHLNFSKTIPDMSKLEPFDGINYRRWSQKLVIFFEQLEIDYILNEDPTKYSVQETQSVVTQIQIHINPLKDSASSSVTPTAEVIKKYEKDNKTVRGHLLNHMTNSLFDLFVEFKSAKDTWDTLNRKYGADDAGRKKYMVGNWLRFQISDDQPIMDQVHIYENLVAAIKSEGMKMCEILQANVLLEKFPLSWSDYRNHPKHKKKDMSLQELISHMRTEEANRLKDKISNLSLNTSNANLIEPVVHGRRDMFIGKDQKQKYAGRGKEIKKVGSLKADGYYFMC